jgi:hypothetical protein
VSLLVDLVDVTTQVPSPLRLDEGGILEVQGAELTDDLTRPDVFLCDGSTLWPDMVVPLVARMCHWESLRSLLESLAEFFGTATHDVVVLVLEVTGRTVVLLLG